MGLPDAGGKKGLKNGVVTAKKEDAMVEISIGHVSSFETDTSGINCVSYKKAISWNNRRKRKADRRRSVREGIFVSLSVKNDRRVLRDRRMGKK
jgi:uncharacterized protein YraI